MRIILQRVSSASVCVDSQFVGEIGVGILALVGFADTDTDETQDEKWIEQMCNLRLFNEGEKGFHLSLRDINGELLVVSQFTLYADCRRGRRPGFSKAMPPELARDRYDQFVAQCQKRAPAKVATGVFGAMMEVSLVNDGPVTIILGDTQDSA